MLDTTDEDFNIGNACTPVPQPSTMKIGYCPPPAFCGGIAGQPCTDERNPYCVDDPRDDCVPGQGGADCGGICVATPPSSTATPTTLVKRARPTDVLYTCGGFVGSTCPEGYRCVDDTSDDCDPETGGADCVGVCIEA